MVNRSRMISLSRADKKSVRDNNINENKNVSRNILGWPLIWAQVKSMYGKHRAAGSSGRTFFFFFFLYFFVNYCVLGEDLDHNISMILRYYLITSRVRLAVVCGPDRVVGDSSYWKTTMIR